MAAWQVSDGRGHGLHSELQKLMRLEAPRVRAPVAVDSPHWDGPIRARADIANGRFTAHLLGSKRSDAHVSETLGAVIADMCQC